MRSANERPRDARAATAVAACAAVLCAACGNYSNLTLDDASFLNALPRASDLKYDVPQGTGQPACLLGESTVAKDSRTLGVGLAVSVGFILGLIDAIRTVPPSQRTADQRTWGPFPDDKHPGIFDRVVMKKLDETPRWSFELDQRAGATGAWLPVLSAEFVGAQARNGQGTLHFDWSALHTLGTSNPTDPQQGTEEIEYALAGDPRTIHITTSGTVSAVEITVAAYADGQARLDLDFTDANGAHITATSKFTSTGAGRANYSWTSGIFGDVVAECWNELYCRTYLKDPGGHVPPCTSAFCELGSIALCPSVH